MWQDIQELSIRSTVNLTLANLFVLVPGLRKLKSLALSADQMLQSREERNPTKGLIANFMREPLSIGFTFDYYNKLHVPCSFQKLK